MRMDRVEANHRPANVHVIVIAGCHGLDDGVARHVSFAQTRWPRTTQSVEPETVLGLRHPTEIDLAMILKMGKMRKAIKVSRLGLACGVASTGEVRSSGEGLIRGVSDPAGIPNSFGAGPSPFVHGASKLIAIAS
jgi:hypothetical protein